MTQPIFPLLQLSGKVLSQNQFSCLERNQEDKNLVDTFLNEFFGLASSKFQPEFYSR